MPQTQQCNDDEAQKPGLDSDMYRLPRHAGTGMLKTRADSLAVAIESGRVVWWVPLPSARHHHDHYFIFRFDQCVHPQLIERQNLQTARASESLLPEVPQVLHAQRTKSRRVDMTSIGAAASGCIHIQ